MTSVTGYTKAKTDELFVAKALVDAKGDLVAATANDTPARVAVGTDGQVLTADAASAAGVKWATPTAATSAPDTLRGVPGPKDHGLEAWSIDPRVITGSVAPTSGTLTLAGIRIDRAVTLANLHVYVGTLGAGLTAGQCLLGLYDSAGTLLGQTADQSTAWTSVGAKKAALVSPVAVTPGVYRVAILAVGTTPPAFSRGANANGQLVNFNLTTASTYLFATADTGRTTFPATHGSLATFASALLVAASV